MSSWWLLWCTAVFGQPAEPPMIYESGVVNAASFLSPPLPSSALAQGSVISIFGTGLGPDTGVRALEFPLLSTLAGVSVDVHTSDDRVLRALPLYVSSTQINAVLPSDTPVGLNLVAVGREGTTGNAVAVRVVRGSVGLFTLPPDRSDLAPLADEYGLARRAIAQRFVSESDQPLVTEQSPARPGETLVLWGTGLGPISLPDADAPPTGNLGTAIEAWIGNRRADVEYGGRAPCCAGVDQFNVRVPEESPTGCFVPIWVTIGNTLHSNVATLPVSPDGAACRPEPQGAAASLNGPVGEILLWRGVDLDEARLPAAGSTRDLAAAIFHGPVEAAANRTVQADSPSRHAAPLQPAGLTALPPPGTCLVYVGDAPPPAHARVTLDAGPSIELTRGAANRAVPRRSEEYRLEAPPDTVFLGPGDYLVNGRGGMGFVAFSGKILALEPAVWQTTSGEQEEVRAEGLSVEWFPQSAAPDSLLLIGRPATQAPGLPVPSFVCSAAATDQAVTVPPAVLANLPASATNAELVSVWGPAPLEFETDGPEGGTIAYLDAQRSPLRLGGAHLPSTRMLLPDGSEIQAELAVTFAERQRGLMNRRSLAAGRGMLFLFENPGNYTFWMLNTLVPLDIIWMDAQRRIVFIARGTPPCPPATACPTYGGQQVAQFVLELAAGQAAAHGLGIGDQLEW